MTSMQEEEQHQQHQQQQEQQDAHAPAHTHTHQDQEAKGAALDEMLVGRAREFARAEHEKIMATLRAGPTPLSAPSTPASTPLAAIAQLAPAHLVGSMAIFQRIYVGSIQFDITEKDLETLFSQFGAVRSVSLMQDAVNRRHRGYGFIEFDTAEAAAVAQTHMDCAELGGRSIKVGRPNNFPSDLPPGVARSVPSRIYVANVHELIQEAELRMVFEAFGALHFCHLAPDHATGKHKGYGYVEYESVAGANAALAALANFELGKRLLRVGKTITGGPPPPGMDSLKNPAAHAQQQKSKVPTAVLRAAQQISDTLAHTRPQAPPPSQAQAQAQGQGQGQSQSQSQAPQNQTHPNTPVILLRNMEDYAALQDTDTIAELEGDVGEECSKFGPVLQCKVHLDQHRRAVLIFVRFASSDAVPAALAVMHLRWFAGRQISAEPYGEEAFARGEYSG